MESNVRKLHCEKESSDIIYKKYLTGSGTYGKVYEKNVETRPFYTRRGSGGSNILLSCGMPGELSHIVKPVAHNGVYRGDRLAPVGDNKKEREEVTVCSTLYRSLRE